MRDLRRRPARRRHLPDVAALDVADVRRVEQRLAVARERGRLHRAVAGRQLDGRRRCCRRRLHRVLAHPFLRLELEDHAIGVGPLDRVDVRERPCRLARCARILLPSPVAAIGRPRTTACSRRGTSRGSSPGCSRDAAVGVSAAAAAPTAPPHRRRLDRAAPRPCAAAYAGPGRIAEPPVAVVRLLAERRAGPANERDPLAVARPRGARVADRRPAPGTSAVRVHVVDADEAVIDAIADERDLRPVGRPARVAVPSPRPDVGLLARPSRVVAPLRDPCSIDRSVLREQRPNVHRARSPAHYRVRDATRPFRSSAPPRSRVRRRPGCSWDSPSSLACSARRRVRTRPSSRRRRSSRLLRVMPSSSRNFVSRTGGNPVLRPYRHFASRAPTEPGDPIRPLRRDQLRREARH